MKQRLKYEKVNNSNDVIKIDLHNGYSVIATSGKTNEEEYITTLFLKDKEFTTLRQIEEGIKFTAIYKTINSAILKYVSDLLENGKMDEYIKSYTFEEECISRGIEVIEKEKFGEKSYSVKKGKLAYKTVYYCGNCEEYVEPEHIHCHNCRCLLNWDILDDEENW